MILADKRVPAGTFWFWLRTRNHHSQTTLGPPRDYFRPSYKINFQAFLDQSGVEIGPSGACIKSEIFGPKKIEKIENFGTDLGWFGGTFGMVWGYFRTDFEHFEKMAV